MSARLKYNCDSLTFWEDAVGESRLAVEHCKHSVTLYVWLSYMTCRNCICALLIEWQGETIDRHIIKYITLENCLVLSYRLGSRIINCNLYQIHTPYRILLSFIGRTVRDLSIFVSILDYHFRLIPWHVRSVITVWDLILQIGI